jgi:hypothetical protein
MHTNRSSRKPSFENSQVTLAGGSGGAGANLYGPQGPWSALLTQREHLNHEIQRAKESLDRMRKDPSRFGVCLQAGGNERQEPARKVAANSVMEQYLLSWVERLEESRCEVIKAIEDMEHHEVLPPLNPEASVYALLRAAG